MPKQKRKRPAPHERPYVSNLELHEALHERLTERELNALEKQIRTAVEIACDRAVAMAITETCKRDWAVALRVLRDRFGFGKERIRRLWETALEYLTDLDNELISTEEMLSVLEREDEIRFHFTVDGKILDGKEENK